MPSAPEDAGEPLSRWAGGVKWDGRSHDTGDRFA